ncbi:MAG: cytochrome c oxidase assembly protein [Alphaproteobacteria bacterium]|jgi:cytochrome c oxidase assembly protein subunit 11|nr:cytochrome c oxidase assembly protein [Alphaproteobacteria bacterium]
MTATRRRGSRWIALALAGVVLGMGGMAYAAVPLYDLFCRATGFGGTPSVAESVPGVIAERLITVRFNADTQSRLPWRFRPAQREVTVRVGESALAFYSARNLSDRALVGTATYNVTPQKVGTYFTKIDCFCFTEQFLGPGASAELPVTFYVDPEILDDPAMDDVTTITLSYMFFDAGEEARARYRAASVAGGNL